MRPVAFRIYDFKSIEDSGICYLSGDGITVLAGQNEAGKTAVLTALRDFDLGVGAAPQTKDFRPEEDRRGADPRVAVEFVDVDLQFITSKLAEENFYIPGGAIDYITLHKKFWVTRQLETGDFSFDEPLKKVWAEAGPVVAGPEQPDPSTATPLDEKEGSSTAAKAVMDANKFAGWLRDFWPQFVYFDAFENALPRQVDFADLQSSLATSSTVTGSEVKPKVSTYIHDFVVMADLDVTRVAALADNDKSLGNYLQQRGAAITGDFLTYWKQKVDKEETVDLTVRHARDSAGKLKLAFYIHDKSDQYPDQRSKGFLWFLAFYLKLNAAQKRYPERPRILLIDEPGSYLHARAQMDVLHMLEARIAKSDAIIYSTHSPYLLPSDRLHRLRIVLKKTEAGTKILDRLTHPDLRLEEFADSLSPIIAAIGIDISQSLTFNRQKNLFVEGMSDYLYLTAWARTLRHDLAETFNIFPGTGATTILNLGSLFTGWGFRFIVLLDNDDQGHNIRQKLVHDLSVDPSRIVGPKDAKTIEDLFSMEDFRNLLGVMYSGLTLNTGESPSAAVKRQNMDKILLARTYAERAEKTDLTKKSKDAIGRLLNELWAAWENPETNI
jgi:hypothetical protein